MVRIIISIKELHLDRREALSRVYRRSYLRIAKIVATAIDTHGPNANALIDQLRERDDNGILTWCFHGNGQLMEPFSQLRRDFPEIWHLCCDTLL